MSYELTYDAIQKFKNRVADETPKMASRSGLSNLISGPTSAMAMIPGQVAGFAGMMFPKYSDKFMDVARNYSEQLTGQRSSAPEIGAGITQAAATIGSPFLAPIIAGGIAKGIEYMRPGKATEEFRSSLGKGTARENIQELGERLKLASKTSKAEALSPKKEFEPYAIGKRIIPNFSKGQYLNLRDSTEPYSISGKLQELHNAYKEHPYYEQADKLLSALKEQVRNYAEKREKSGLSDTEKPRYEQFKRNLQALQSDMDKFANLAPAEQKGKYGEFRQKYKKYAETYEEGPQAIRLMAKGKAGEVSPEKIGSGFTEYTDQMKRILTDIGPEGGKQILYNAVRNVPANDAHKMAKTILDLKKTKGYDLMVTPEIEKWAKDMIKRYWITKALSTGAGGIVGESLGGHWGALAGAAAPWAKEIGSKGLELLKYLKK